MNDIKTLNAVMTNEQVAALSHLMTNQCDACRTEYRTAIFQSPDSAGVRESSLNFDEAGNSVNAHGCWDDDGESQWVWDWWDATKVEAGTEFVFGSGSSTAYIGMRKQSENAWAVTCQQDVIYDQRTSQYFKLVDSISVPHIYSNEMWMDFTERIKEDVRHKMESRVVVIDTPQYADVDGESLHDMSDDELLGESTRRTINRLK